ncbi:MAG: ribosomal L7Ae/L30e/S12e/Gadd45 family protein [Clostridia bacterium]|nr:ribosomal L7Ae/L30e/S12e/Gadd45 family protein [Clostridia bacterium]
MDTQMKKHFVVGRKQTAKAVKSGAAAKVFLASDADPAICDELRALCEACGIPVDESMDMQSLGRACGIEVSAAAAAVTKA